MAGASWKYDKRRKRPRPRGLEHLACFGVAERLRLCGKGQVLSDKRLFDSDISEAQRGAVFDAAESFEAESHHLWTVLSVVGSPSSKPGDDPGREGQCTLRMRVLLPGRSAFELNRQGFKHRLVIGLKRLDQIF